MNNRKRAVPFIDRNPNFVKIRKECDWNFRGDKREHYVYAKEIANKKSFIYFEYTPPIPDVWPDDGPWLHVQYNSQEEYDAAHNTDYFDPSAYVPPPESEKRVKVTPPINKRALRPNYGPSDEPAVINFNLYQSLNGFIESLFPVKRISDLSKSLLTLVAHTHTGQEGTLKESLLVS